MSEHIDYQQSGPTPDMGGEVPSPGDEVLIPKGAYVTGTHKSLPKHTTRNQRVRVFSYREFFNEVTWVGQGGYWFDCKQWRWPADSSSDGGS